MPRKVLITGSNSGFGTLAVGALIAAGHQVAASMRNPTGRKKIASELEAVGAHVVEIDVTDEASVERGVAGAITELGGLDVLINNAGVGVSGLIESFTSEDFKRLFDVNVFGVQRMNRAVAPLLRKQRSGLLIHVSSLLGRMTMPFYGPYNATKWAVEAISENYRTELSQFGVETCVIEPGGFPTTFIANLMKPSDRSRDVDYGELAKAPEATLHGFHELLKNTPAQDPRNVANVMVDLVGMKEGERPFRTVVDALGMGEAIAPYNEQLHQLTAAIYANMNIEHMLTLEK